MVVEIGKNSWREKYIVLASTVVLFFKWLHTINEYGFKKEVQLKFGFRVEINITIMRIYSYNIKRGIQMYAETKEDYMNFTVTDNYIT